MIRQVSLAAAAAALALLLMPAVLSGARADEGAAGPGDTASPEALIAAVYDVISGPADEARDWDRFRRLFHEQARLVSVGADGALVMNVEDYIARAAPFFRQGGFYETEIARKEDSFADIVHVMSTYEARYPSADRPVIRGVNSVQLVREDGRWLVLTILWQAESDDTPLPAEYLPQ